LPDHEHRRKPFELRGGFGALLATCVAGAHALCTGASGDAALTWRTSPVFGWGLALRYGRTGSDSGTSPVTFEHAFVGLAARVHFVEVGSFDPYVDLSTGVGFVGGASAEQSVALTPGPELEASLGFDLFMTQDLKLGPYVAVGERFGAYQGLCTVDPACIDGGASPWHTSLLLGLRATWTAGQPM
jgi:hypothetical protein